MQLVLQNFRGRQRPAGQPRINWNHPLSRGLVGAWLLDGTIPYNLVTGEQAVRTGTGQGPSAGSEGAECNFNQAANTLTNYYTVHSGPLIGGQANWSVVSGFRGLTLGSGGANYCMYVERAASGNDILKHALAGTGTANWVGGFTYRNDGGTLINANTASTTFNDNNFHVMHTTKAGASAGNNAFAYVDAIQTTAASWNSNDNFTNSGIKCLIGGDIADSASGYPNTISFVYIFKIAHSPSEVDAFSADPYAFLIFPDDDILSLMVAKIGTTVTLDVSINEEYLSSVSYTPASIMNYLSSFNRDGYISDEYSAIVRADYVLLSEFSSSVRRDYSIPQDDLSSLASNGIIPEDYGATILGNIAALIEYANIVQTTFLIPVEYSGAQSVIMSASLPVDWRSTFAADTSIIEAINASLQNDKIIPADFQSTILRDYVIPLATLSLFQGQSFIPAETLASLVANTSIPEEFMQSASGVSISIPIQIMQSILRDVINPVDSRHTFTSDSPLPVETTTTARFSDTTSPAEYLSTILLDGIGYIDWSAVGLILPVNPERLLPTGARRRIGYKIVRQV